MIIIFGSITMDVYINVHDFPKEGLPALSRGYVMNPGGKGANQALAAARCGAKTALVGKVGDDGMGHRVLNNLKRNEVMTSGVARSEKFPTGMSFVAKNHKQKRQVIFSMGANAEISHEQVPDEILGPSNMIVMQMEVPREENIAVMERAKMNGAKILLNLAPAVTISDKELKYLDYLVVNQIEARALAHALKIDADFNYPKIAEALAKAGDLTCVLTMGDKGSVAVTPKGETWTADAMVLQEVVDVSGAGDCFTGTLAAAIYNKKSIGEALRMASVAAGLACQKKNAQDSFPYLGEIEENIKAVDFPLNQ